MVVLAMDGESCVLITPDDAYQPEHRLLWVRMSIQDLGDLYDGLKHSTMAVCLLHLLGTGDIIASTS